MESKADKLMICLRHHLKSLKLIQTACGSSEIPTHIIEELSILRQEFRKTYNELSELSPIPEAKIEISDCHTIKMEFDEIYFDLIMKVEPKTDVKPDINSNVIASQSLPGLPRVSIPPFGGEISQYQNFISLYDVLIHNNEQLKNCQKFQYLRMHLRGDALQIIANLPLTEENYSVAYKAITQRYANNRRLATYYFSEMFQFNNINRASFANYQQFISVFTNATNALQQLSIDHFDFFMFAIAYEKLDASTKSMFEVSLPTDHFPTFKELINFVTDRLRSIELLEMHPANNIQEKPHVIRQIHTSSKVNPHYVRSSFPPRQPKALMVEDRRQSAPLPSLKEGCLFCKSSSHNVYTCPDFLLLSTDDRYKEINRLKRCYCCLGNHLRKFCKSLKTCKVCFSKEHNSLLHIYNSEHSAHSGIAPPRLQTDSVTPHQSEASNKKLAGLHNLSSLDAQSSVLLGTAYVNVMDNSNVTCPVRAVVDNGSQVTMITHRAVKRLGLRIQPNNTSIYGISDKPTVVRGSVCLQLTSPVLPHWNLSCEALVVQQIVDQLPAAPITSDIKDRFFSLKLADPNFMLPANVDMLLGADIYAEISVPNHNTVVGQPSAINSVFGWIVLGKVSNLSPTRTAATSLLTITDQLNSDVQRFWEIEEIPSARPPHPDDVRCEEIFTSTTTRDSTGRYVVALPFKSQPASLSVNRNSSLRQVNSLLNRLNKQKDILPQYHAFMQEYIELKHMSIALKSSSYVIPHHCVMKASSSTTKLRTVFNASHPMSSGQSLNDQLLPGPKLQRDIRIILIQFRLHPVVVCADIKMMYRQILIREEDRCFQHIFYQPQEESSPQEYELNTVTYGVTPSAFLAQRVLLQLAKDEGHNFPLASHAIQNHTYVDDIITGAVDIEEALQLQSQLISLFSLGGFALRKWSSNCQELVEDLPHDHLENPLSFSENETNIKILGLQWTPKSDHFSYSVCSFSGIITKRSVLSHTARMFDPLGFISPVIFWAKHFLKLLWQHQLSWDQEVPHSLSSEWMDYTKQIMTLQNISIPRFVGINNAIYRILGFCDASEKGYAAVIYLHCQKEDSFSLHLIAARSRISPSKPLSIPRLELCAALLLAKLYDFILDSVTHLQVEEVRLHTDAQIVLGWLNTAPHLLKTFVANRVVQITEITPITFWSHIESASNPADVASRGCLPHQLLDHELWWSGPSCYQSLAQDWPLPVKPSFSEAIIELRQTSFLQEKVKPHLSDEILHRFSTLTRMFRVIAFVLRFIKRSRKISTSHVDLILSPQELQESKFLCVRITQRCHFNAEIKQVEEGNLKSNSFRALSPYADPLGLLRVGGRLKHSSLPENARHPLLLPKKSHLTHLVCDHFHLKSLHSGPRTTQALILQEYWIVSLRSVLRWRIHNCVSCIRHRAAFTQPLMADLPSHRVTALRAFQSIGLDYAGPFQIKLSKVRNSRCEKGYLCIFVCMSTKAVHLECVTEMTTSAFLAAFDRFVSRRGLPSDIFSDNGTNFVGADNYLKEIRSHLIKCSPEIASTLANRKILWHFNPPAAPNFGGLWESAVKSTKLLLRRTLGTHKLTYEELSTLFTRIEGVLNSRPLFEPSPDPHEEMLMLTPGHFLIGQSLLQAPEPAASSAVTSKTRWILLRQLFQSFWTQWSNQYLHSQIMRSKWNKSTPPLQVGQIVIVHSPNLPPAQWMLGKIISVIPNLDGIPRIANVKTASGEITRPITKLVPIPMGQLTSSQA